MSEATQRSRDSEQSLATMLNEQLGGDAVNAFESEMAGGVLAIVADDAIGRFMGLARREGWSVESQRSPDSQSLIATIETDTTDSSESDDQRSLADLFR